MPILTSRHIDLYLEGQEHLVKRQPKRGYKETTLRGLNYVKRFLAKSVGRGWNNVENDLRHSLLNDPKHLKVCRAFNENGYSLNDIFEFFVFKHVVYLGKTPYVIGYDSQLLALDKCRHHRGFYVDHRGILRVQPKQVA